MYLVSLFLAPQHTNHRLYYSLFAILLGCFCFSQPATAAPAKVRIAVMSRAPQSGISPGRAAWLQRFLRWSLRKQTRLEVLQDAAIKKQLYSKPVPTSVKVRIRVFRRYLAKAKALYGMTRFPMARRCQYALRALRVCEKMAQHIKNYLDSPALLQKLYLYYALAHFGIQDQKKTQLWSLELAALDPDYDPSTESGVPSTYTTYFQRLIKWLRSQPRYSMVVDSVPSGAKLYHNFGYVGTTPFTLKRLIRGKHNMRLEQPGYETWERAANLDPQKLGKRRTITVKIPLKRDPNALTLKSIPIFAQDAAISDDILDRLERISKRLDVKHLYVVEPSRTGNNHLLKIAIFKQGDRQIKYKFLSIGNSRNTFRPRITAFAAALANQIAPAPIVRRPPRRLVVRQPVRRAPDVTYRPPPRRAQQITPITREEPPARPTVIAAKTPKRRTPPPITNNGPTPFYSTWWFWTATIGGAIVAASAVVLIVNMNGPPPTATLIITTNTLPDTP